MFYLYVKSQTHSYIHLVLIQLPGRVLEPIQLCHRAKRMGKPSTGHQSNHLHSWQV